MSCGVGHRSGLAPTLLWLGCSPEAAAQIQPLAREPPDAEGVALKSKQRKKKKKETVLLQKPFFLPFTETRHRIFSLHQHLGLPEYVIEMAENCAHKLLKVTNVSLSFGSHFPL